MRVTRRVARRSNSLRLLTATIAVCACFAATADAQDYVAGSAPSVRPATAPVVRGLDRPDDWLAKAAAGVSLPYPASLKFLNDQGNWYTPFTRPGMPGPYDIRGLHASSGQ